MNLLEFDKYTDAHKDELANLVRKYLTSNGWKYTCDHPGGFWLWTIARDISTYDCQLYAVHESIALKFQRHWEMEAQHFNSHDEFCPIFKTFDWDDCNCMPDPENDTEALDGHLNG